MTYILLNFDEFFFLKIGNWEGKINLGKKNVLEKKNHLLKINVLGEGERNHAFSKLHIFILLHLIISSSWVKNAVETRFFFSGRVNKGQESLLQRLQPICFYIDPWKAILGFSCSEHDGRSFSWCLFWNPFFVPLLLCDSCHVHWLKLNFLTCNVSRMHSHVTLEWKFLYSQCVCLNVCIQIKEWKFYLLNYSSASDV